jgi:hypothetical protein
MDDVFDEAWQRFTDDPQVRGVEANRLRDFGEWSVFVCAMEFVREEPLESELRLGIGAALRGTPGVSQVAEEDREVWRVGGSPTGDALTRAVADAVDEFAPRVRAHIEALGQG